MTDTSLTTLCLICHVNPPKYTCPRCLIHTCSLACVKQHKQRAQCSGLRDPGTYVRRSELATEEGVDRDFNFIASVERGVSRGEEVGEAMGLVPLGVGMGKGWKGREKDRKWVDVVAERGVRVVRAPEGLTRRKQNKSALKGGGLMWTVEWIGEGSKRVVNVSEDKSVGESYLMCFGKKGRKRKRDEPKTEEPTGEIGQNYEETTNDDVSIPQNDDDARKEDNTPKDANTTPNLYLHRPQTNSKLKCLIPIPPTSTWKEILKDRTVLEFPTVYIVDETPEMLVRPFILEERYLGEHGEDVLIAAVRDGGAGAGNSGGKDGEGEGERERGGETVVKTFDEGELVEVIGKDVGEG